MTHASAAPVRLLDGESAQPGYIPGDVVAEPYRSRRASPMGEVHYQFQVQTGKRYQLSLGFCERRPHPHVPITYPIEIVIEGRTVRSLDVAGELGPEEPHELLFPARDENGDGRLDVVVRPAASAVDPTAWISRIRLLEGERALADVNCGAEGPEVEIALVSPDRAACAYNAVLSSGNQWAYFGVNGEVRELWARGRLYAPRVPRYSLTSGFLSLKSGDEWLDSRRLEWDYRWLPESNILALAARAAGAPLRLAAFAHSEEDLLTLQYHRQGAAGAPFRYSWISQHQDWDTPILETWEHGVVLRSRSLEFLALAASVPVSVEWATPQSHHVRLVGAWPEETLSIFIAVGRDPAALKARLSAAAGSEAAELLRGEEARQRAWLARASTVSTPDPAMNRLYTRALLNIRGNSFDTGVVIAGSDGWYKHTWIRDGGYTVMGLARAGLHAEAERFHRYWLADEGFSYGGENECQQPAIGILGFLHHFHHARDRRLLADAWPYVERYADYYRDRVQKEGMIHTAEEWINQIPAQTAWPNAEIYAGLLAAAEISLILGKQREDDWRQAAAQLRSALLEGAYDPALARFRPLSGRWIDDRVDSGMLNLARLGALFPGVSVCPPEDLRMASTLFQIKRDLEQADSAISRFTGNPNGHGYAGGQWPTWPISTAWMAQVHLLLGEPSAALRYCRAIAHKEGYAYDAALWYLPEQISIPGAPVSTRNLAWSNGEYLNALFGLLVGAQPDARSGRVVLAPGLPVGWPAAEIERCDLLGAQVSLRHERQGAERRLTLRHRGGEPVRLAFRLPADALPDPLGLQVNGEPVGWSSEVGFVVPAGEWLLSASAARLELSWQEPVAPPCGVDWSGWPSASVAGLDELPGGPPEAQRLSAALALLLDVSPSPTEPGVIFRAGSLEPTEYRIMQAATGSPVEVEYGAPPGALRAARRLVLELEGYFRAHRLAALREANSDLARHLGRRP